MLGVFTVFCVLIFCACLYTEKKIGTGMKYQLGRIWNREF
jgi:hypothetical protein